ncbi:short-chain alcohol dehydrogenase [Desulfocapsa sulfexigens DSM 10523]|uniref:Short-chain alcohol dehydrogenase n=1 Tax=Desulfocapsa sulfexigens (strain DSM 10523 / SB164P1) TaxID=1167006 RepID=M1P6Q7_DESSD|nr:SDR family oxidoreductase [Desulfocapsa sulfexigens]AGF77387.1 short-chain alcohol dehydrogenase [Desulfocapsa sulfexigens DSM 10523]
MTKTAFITGATSGFGRACAEIFAEKGWDLVLCGRREERLQELQNQLTEVAVHTVVCDVRKREQVENMVKTLPESHSNIDLLVNNAGLALGMKPAQDADLDDWENMVDTNIKGLLYVTRALLPAMVSRGKGDIINIGSIAGSWPYPGGNAYGATKAFVKQFSNNLRADLHGTGIRVSNVEPGLAESEFSVVRFHGDKEKADAVYEGTEPLTPVDIAEIVYWLADRPSHVNVNRLEVMPVCQSWSPFAIHRKQ